MKPRSYSDRPGNLLFLACSNRATTMAFVPTLVAIVAKKQKLAVIDFKGKAHLDG